MAEQDTGLGWSAEAEWLVNVTGEIANYSTFGGSSFPDQPIPQTGASFDDFANIWAGGLTIGTNSNTGRIMKIGSSPYAPVIAALDSTTSGNTRRGMWAVSPVNSTSIPTASARVISFNSSGTAYSNASISTSSLDTATGLYYKYITLPDSMTQYLTLPEYSSLSALLADIEIVTASFEKENAGYSVACAVKWKTGNGTELVSPILISSNTDFVDMTTTGTGNYMAKFNKLLSGVRFYMAFWDIAGNTNLVTPLQRVDLTDRGNMDLEQLFMTIISTSYAHVIIINSPDPYEEEGAGSEEEGGDGEETGDDDAGIEAGSDFPSAINTGFCRIYSPSESELRNLSNYLWSNSYDLAQVKKLFSNPMDSILGLSAVPIRLLGSSVSFSLGGVPISGMTLPLVTQQRYTYHMGSITIKERWGSYLDYDPYTKFSIFLPFIGMRELAADDIMGKTVSLVYDIDILTGMCVARLQAGTNCLYEWGGNCAIQLPINSRNWDSVFSTAVSAVGGIVSAVTGGSAPLVAGSVASAALQTVSMKPRIDKSSTIGGAAGWLGQMTPYIIRTTPEAFIPTDQNKFIGYPAYINVALDSISGYNEVDSIHLENVTATGAELDEIETILKGGVIF